MSITDIASRRLQHQQLQKTALKTPDSMVSFFGAMQAQDYASSKWGIGARLPGCTHADVENAIRQKKIIRTTVFRGTLHLVAAADVRWMLQLAAPSVRTRGRSMQRKLGLDEPLFDRIKQLLIKLLEGGKQLTRKEITAYLQANGINTDENRMNHILYEAAISGITCNGALREKQFTYTLLDEWLPASDMLDKETALQTLARRFFTSHGPATVADFAQWSGFPMKEAREGLESARSALVAKQAGDVTWWMAPGRTRPVTTSALLLPAFDEYFVGYKDRSTVIDMRHASKVMTLNGIFNPLMVRDGQVIGAWKRTIKKDTVSIVTAPFRSMKKAELKDFEPAALRYAAFLGFTLQEFK
ncbi:winged helix DNA-binding domain-containing protein [Chitinophaga sp. 212800010-3]|uniref:winged helix DNA-binding domain-containing protein n=1 Tax=unclassified Chitinophaga TaxID=2619133 RepID=UPI002DF1FF97|nr:Winged helix DNA-binding protein [Chitinophaga sp. 212800010-3]